MANEKDSVQAIVNYIQEVKPFHSKVLEVDAENTSDEFAVNIVVENLVIEDDMGVVYISLL